MARRKRKKRRRTVSGKSKVFSARKKTAKRKCGLCRKVLHGVPHGKSIAEVRKLSKTKRRPATIFGGVLCSSCRSRVTEEAVKVGGKIKEVAAVDAREKPYVQIMVNKIAK